MSASVWSRRACPAPGSPARVAIASSSRVLLASTSPGPRSLTVPPPYSPLGISPSNSRYSSGWSSVRTTSGSSLGPVGTPRGSAKMRERRRAQAAVPSGADARRCSLDHEAIALAFVRRACGRAVRVLSNERLRVVVGGLSGAIEYTMVARRRRRALPARPSASVGGPVERVGDPGAAVPDLVGCGGPKLGVIPRSSAPARRMCRYQR